MTLVSADYGATISPETLAVKQNKDSRTASPDIAKLAGSRLVIASEPPKRMIFNTSPAYADTEDGLEEFKQTTIDYFQYVRDTNASPDIDKKLVPDIEALCTFLGITRRTLLTYEQQRGSSWQDFIKQTKNARAACKKELAYHMQIPPVIAMFDLSNNHGYVNTSEFKIEAISDKTPVKPPTLEQQISDAGLVWSDVKGEFIPAIEGEFKE